LKEWWTAYRKPLIVSMLVFISGLAAGRVSKWREVNTARQYALAAIAIADQNLERCAKALFENPSRTLPSKR
jgi:hypothetical protein